MTSEKFDALDNAVETQLSREKRVTPEGIRTWIAALRAVPLLSVSDEECEKLARKFEVQHGVTMSYGVVLQDKHFTPWLEQELAEIDFFYWNRYRKLLVSKHYSSQVITTLHDETDRTLGLLENPAREGRWNRRGMVVGHVQSGKTGNYIGLLCKAADAGYRLIVVIAGVHNNLRNQTQKRLDEGFVGRDSARLLSRGEDKYIGVGQFDPSRRPVTFTNSVKDFSKEMATGVGVPLENLKEPAVFVIKKNSSTLKNLVEWLREHNASRGNKTVDTPMLLIDDEADNASINVSYGKDEVSKINGKIRDLLGLFSRSCYVGYTATPFANIFIDPDGVDERLGQDLFPRHFILSLDPPSNYFGADRLFGDDASDVLRTIIDDEEFLPLSHKKDFVVTSLPPSLTRAIRTFILARAVRLCRGHVREHCSMLVNASRFMSVQNQLRNLIQATLTSIQASIRLSAALLAPRALRDPELSAFHEIWTTEFSDLSASWEDVRSQLIAAAAPIKVVEVNSRSSGTLNYSEYQATGLSVIAVGGYALSRGLTLEGLMISYFLRNSQMYDTLMQMGRWFGYRRDYEDLCRVWMTEETEGSYALIADAIEELREELRIMAAAGATPEEFGLKVRAHPKSLIVTARNKMGSGQHFVVKIGLASRFIETALLKNDQASLSSNRRAASILAANLTDLGIPIDGASRVDGGWLLSNVPVSAIQIFLASFANHPLSVLTDPKPVGRYIEDRSADELAKWDLLIAGTRKASAKHDTSLGLDVECQVRTAGSRTDAMTLRITNKQRVASRGVERTGVDRVDIEEAEREYDLRSPRQGGKRPNYPDRIYRARRKRPLLILHLLQVLKSDGSEQNLHDDAVVAWSISFPGSKLAEDGVEYVVTTTWIRENIPNETEEFEADDFDVE